jgi:hypothetical protein
MVSLTISIVLSNSQKRRMMAHTCFFRLRLLKTPHRISCNSPRLSVRPVTPSAPRLSICTDDGQVTDHVEGYGRCALFMSCPILNRTPTLIRLGCKLCQGIRGSPVKARSIPRSSKRDRGQEYLRSLSSCLELLDRGGARTCTKKPPVRPRLRLRSTLSFVVKTLLHTTLQSPHTAVVLTPTRTRRRRR